MKVVNHLKKHGFLLKNLLINMQIFYFEEILFNYEILYD